MDELACLAPPSPSLSTQSDPFVEIAKAQEGGTFTVVYRSQPIMKTLTPRWKGFTLSVQKLCSGDWDRALKISVWDWNRYIRTLYTVLVA